MVSRDQTDSQMLGLRVQRLCLQWKTSQFLRGCGEPERSPPTRGRMRIPVLCLRGGEHSALTRCFVHYVSRVSKNKDDIQQPLGRPALSGPGG